MAFTIRKKPQKEQQRKIYSGGEKSFNFACKINDYFNMPYKVTTYGSTREIEYGGQVQRFVFKTGFSSITSIGSACRCMMLEVDKYLKDNEPIRTEYRSTNYSNGEVIVDYIMKGGRKINAVDMSACYWNILHNAGIISDKFYYKYLPEKEIRLVAVGNLTKKRISAIRQGGKTIKSSEIEVSNQYSWVWDYVIYKAYEIFETVNKALNNKVIMYKTDCFYIVENDLPALEKEMQSIGYEYTVKNFTIVARRKGSLQIVLVDEETGEMKLSYFGNNRGLMFLPEMEITAAEVEAMNDSIEKKEKSINK